MTQAPKITFLPDDVTVAVRDDESVFDVARRSGVVVETACVGNATCGLCRVRVVSGEDNLSPYNGAEEKHLGNLYHLTKLRLSCQAVVRGDVTVEIVPRRRRRKRKP